MEVRIGVLHAPREISFESRQTPEELDKAVAQALSSGDVLRLEDERGGLVIIPADKLAYVELGAPRRGGVGFGTL